MNWKTKAGIIGVIILLITSLLLIVKLQHDQLQKMDAIEKQNVELKRVNDNLVRSSASYISKKDLELAIKNSGVDLSDLKKDLNKLNAQVAALNTTTVLTPGYYGTGISSTTSVPTSTPVEVVECKDGKCVNPDKWGYLSTTEQLELNEPFGKNVNVPWGKVGFTASNEKPWDLEVYPRKYRSITVISRDKDGRTFTHTQFAVDVNGESYNVPIDDSKLVEKVPAKKFRFSPRLYLGLDFGALVNKPSAEVTPSLQVSMFSYGSMKTSPDFTVLGVGVGYETQEKDVSFVVTPATYNVAKHVPFMDNLHIGPSVTIDTGGNVGIMGGLRVGL